MVVVVRQGGQDIDRAAKSARAQGVQAGEASFGIRASRSNGNGGRGYWKNLDIIFLLSTNASDASVMSIAPGFHSASYC